MLSTSAIPTVNEGKETIRKVEVVTFLIPYDEVKDFETKE